jgi:hypothetical protein
MEEIRDKNPPQPYDIQKTSNKMAMLRPSLEELNSLIKRQIRRVSTKLAQ